MNAFPDAVAGKKPAGFTLLEVMIAMAILGIAVAAIFDLMKVGLLSTEASEGYSRASYHAQAKMGELLTTLPMEPEAKSGGFEDGYTFETSISLYQLPGLEQQATSGLTAAGEAGGGAEVYLLDVVIGMPNQDRKLHLQSLRAVPKQGVQP